MQCKRVDRFTRQGKLIVTKAPCFAVDKPRAGGFFRTRWRGETYLSQLYWRDIWVVGSFINLFTGFIALMIAARGGNVWVAAMVHFASMPYNVFLVLALWRMPGRSKMMALTSLVWLGVMTML